MILNFSLEFFLNEKNFLKILNFKKKIFFKPKFITITYNNLKLNKNLLNYFIKKKIKIFSHIICKKNVFKFNYLINLYYINNLKNFVLIKGDQQKNFTYYSYNFLNILIKNYKKNLKIILGCYVENHQYSLKYFFDIKNLITKNLINKNSFFITQYFYNYNNFFYYLDNLNKINNLNIIPGIMNIFCLKSLISFSNICKSELPNWILKNSIFCNFKKNSFIKVNFEIIINFILKLIIFKLNFFHIYTMNKINFVFDIVQKLTNIINL